MAAKIAVYSLGIALGIGFAWFALQVTVLGLRAFFSKNNKTNNETNNTEK